MKRIISIFLMMIFASQMAFAQGAEKNKVSCNTDGLLKAVTVLNDIGVTELSEETEVWEEKTVTRAEFVEMTSKAFRIETYSEAVYFTDVPKNMWAYKAVTDMAELGYISIPDDRKFRPDDNITYAEALKIILNLANYGGFAEGSGGYPNGYINLAHRLEISVTGGHDYELTTSGAVTLIYEVMSMGRYNSNVYTGKFGQNDETIFEQLWNIHIERGTLNACYGAAYQSSVREENEVIIDDEVYLMENEKNLEDYFLNEVEFIYKKSRQDIEGTIIYLENTDKNKEILISSDDIHNFNKKDYSLEYYVNQRRVNTKIERGSIVIYNGAVWDGSLEAVFEEFTNGDKRGYVRLKEYDNSNSVNMVIVKSYRDFVVGYEDARESRLYSIFNSTDVIEFDAYSQILVKSVEGDKATLDLSSLPLLLNVAEAKDGSVIEMVVCYEKITAKPEAVEEWGDEVHIVLNGKKHTFEKNMYKNQLLDENGISTMQSALLGSEYQFFIDKFGYIGYMSKSSAGADYKLGLITEGFYREDDNGEKKLTIKVLTESDGVIPFKLGKRVCIDAVYYKADDVDKVIAALEKGAEVNKTAITDAIILKKLSKQPIRYKTDENNNIIEIDTVFVGDSENRDTTLTVLPDVYGRTDLQFYYGGGINKFGLNILYNSAITKVFAFPFTDKDGNLIFYSDAGKTGITKATGVGGAENPVLDINGNSVRITDEMHLSSPHHGGFDSDVVYSVRAYKFDPSTAYSDLIVNEYNWWRSQNENIFVDRIVKVCNKDDEVVNVLYGRKGATETAYEIADNSDISDLSRGDIIYCLLDGEGRIGLIKKVYDAEDDKFMNYPYSDTWNRKNAEFAWSMNTATIDGAGNIIGVNTRTENAMTKGVVLNKAGNVLMWDFDGNYRTFEEAYDFSKAPLVFYEKSGEKENVYVSTVAAVPDYASVGENAARIVFCKDREMGVCGFIYLNN